MDLLRKLFGRKPDATPEMVGTALALHAAKWTQHSLELHARDVQCVAAVPTRTFLAEAHALNLFAVDQLIFQIYGDTPARTEALKALEREYHRLRLEAPDFIYPAAVLNERTQGYFLILRAHAETKEGMQAIGIKFAEFCGADHDPRIWFPAAMAYQESLNTATSWLSHFRLVVNSP